MLKIMYLYLIFCSLIIVITTSFIQSRQSIILDSSATFPLWFTHCPNVNFWCTIHGGLWSHFRFRSFCKSLIGHFDGPIPRTGICTIIVIYFGEKIWMIILKGPSLNDVRSFSRILDPPPPLSDFYSIKFRNFIK